MPQSPKITLRTYRQFGTDWVTSKDAVACVAKLTGSREAAECVILEAASKAKGPVAKCKVMLDRKGSEEIPLKPPSADGITVTRRKLEASSRIVAVPSTMWTPKLNDLISDMDFEFDVLIKVIRATAIRFDPNTKQHLIVQGQQRLAYGISFHAEFFGSIDYVNRTLFRFSEGVPPHRLPTSPPKVIASEVSLRPRRQTFEHDWDEILKNLSRLALEGRLEVECGAFNIRGNQAVLERKILDLSGASEAAVRRKAVELIELNQKARDRLEPHEPFEPG
jgi:hypothetical protein